MGGVGRDSGLGGIVPSYMGWPISVRTLTD